MTGDSPYNNYNPDRGRHSFEIASIVMGIISMVLLCTGVLAIPFGALGVLFALLSRKDKDRLGNIAITGAIISVVSMITGAFITVYSVYTVMTDPSVLEEVSRMYARYGIEMPTIPTFYSEGGSLWIYR
ncbi:MAG: hypothetical protein J5696_00255 [Lachnospiraceae bacterium]|nr:hypothetical protein [Lachnospiraceae bacterium]